MTPTILGSPEQGASQKRYPAPPPLRKHHQKHKKRRSTRQRCLRNGGEFEEPK